MVCGPNHRVGTTETEQQNATHQECLDARKEIFVRLNNLKKGYAFSCSTTLDVSKEDSVSMNNTKNSLQIWFFFHLPRIRLWIE